MRPWVALLAVSLAGCTHRAQPLATTPATRYVIGPAYQSGGVWSYPQERFQYQATGLADRLPDATGLTADGELADPGAMAGAHRTLQLPAIVDVTNLDNGRQIRIRLNDRGPANPGRLLGLTRRAADLLGVPLEAPAPVRVDLDSDASQALRDKLGGGPRGIVAAPVGKVRQEALAPPGQSRHVRADVGVLSDVPDAPADQMLERLPETVQVVPAQPGRLWIRLGQFTQSRYAQNLKQKVRGVPVEVLRTGGVRQSIYAVRAGPFATVAGADSALDQLRASGVTDASIVVE